MGDNAYPSGSSRQFDDCYGPNWDWYKVRSSYRFGTNLEWERHAARTRTEGNTGPYLQDYAGPGAASTKRWRQVFGQRLNVTSLVLSDVLLALLSLKVATLLQDVWGRGALTELAIATAVPAVALWVGLRASMGLYLAMAWTQ